MARKVEQAPGTELGGLLSVESSVLRALCLTINMQGSVIKDKMLDTLTKDHFYFPINKALFAALRDMHHRGDYVVLSNLEDELHNLAMEVPEDLHLEDLFRGDPPKLPEVTEWVERLKERAAKGESAAPAAPPEPQPAVPAPPAKGEAPAARVVETPPAGREAGVARIKAVPETRKVEPEPERPPKTRPASADAAEGRPRQVGPPVLSSEGEEWTSYLQEVAAKQGKTFETGFAGLDERAGGLSPGLMLLVDQNASRLGGFLKQLADQVVARSNLPCLYLSFVVPKAVLRVRTLARLSGVPARDIEKGRLKKGSPEWESVERNGREAAEWLKALFVVDAEPTMDLSQVRDMGRQLLESRGTPTCLVVVDSLEKMGTRGESPQAMVAGLKDLATSLDVLVVAGTANKALSSEPGVDFVGTVREVQGAPVQLELLRAEDSHSTTLRFDYQPDCYRFTEQPGT